VPVNDQKNSCSLSLFCRFDIGLNLQFLILLRVGAILLKKVDFFLQLDGCLFLSIRKFGGSRGVCIGLGLSIGSLRLDILPIGIHIQISRESLRGQWESLSSCILQRYTNIPQICLLAAAATAAAAPLRHPLPKLPPLPHPLPPRPPYPNHKNHDQ